NGQRLELIDGHLKERPPMGAAANRVATVLITRLEQHSSARKLGLVFGQECGYQIFPRDRKKVRKPDGSFIARGRLPGDCPPPGHVLIPPDLVLEVVSPNDLAEEIDLRLSDYLEAGARLLWVVYPTSRAVHVFRTDGSGACVREGQQLSGEDV